MAVWQYSIYVYSVTFYSPLLNLYSVSLIELLCVLREERIEEMREHEGIKRNMMLPICLKDKCMFVDCC